jgi:hypothetical protein
MGRIWMKLTEMTRMFNCEDNGWQEHPTANQYSLIDLSKIRSEI